MGRELTPLTESGALTALAVALAVISTAMPILGGFFLLAWPVPIAVLSCRHGLRWALLACLTSGILLTFMISPLGAAGIVLAYGPVGLALGHGFRRGWSAARTFALGVAGGTLGQAACVGLLLALGGISPFALTLAEMHEVVEQTLALQRASGVPEGEIAALREQMDAGLEFFSQMAPVLFFLMALIFVTAGYIFTANLLRRMGTEVPMFPAFREWRLPQGFGYLFGFAMVGIYWGGTREIPLLFQISVAGELIALLAGAVQGFSLMSCVMEHFKLTRTWRIVFYVLVAINGLFLQILALTGLFDMFFDYRRRFGRRE